MSDFERGFREELEKLAEEGRMKPTLSERHPVATGVALTAVPVAAALLGAGLHSPEAGQIAGRLAGAGSIGGQFGIAASEHKRLKQLTPEQQAQAQWFARHPYLSAALLGPIATGLTAHQTGKALEEAGKFEE